MTDPEKTIPSNVNDATLASETTSPASETDETIGDSVDRSTGKDNLEFPDVGRYQIVQKLGSGAMGSVFLAEDPMLQRQVALKIPIINGANARERFFREARAIAKLRHANICPVFDVGEVNDQLFIAMAFIEGKDLQEFLGGTKMKSRRATANLCRKIADAMHHAHSENVVHRDLKPANIMLDSRHEPLIMDFGLAQNANEDTKMTQTGVLMGSPSYMSPEQVRAKPDEIGPATDIYSLGVILYEMLTGELPFVGSLGELMMQILTKDPQPPRKKDPSIDERLEVICLRMMAKDINHRYPSMKEVRHDLKRFLLETQKQTSTKPSDPGIDIDEKLSKTTTTELTLADDPPEEPVVGNSDTSADQLGTLVQAKIPDIPSPTSMTEVDSETSLLRSTSLDDGGLDRLEPSPIDDLSELADFESPSSPSDLLPAASWQNQPHSTEEKKTPSHWHLNMRVIVGAGVGIFVACILGLIALLQLVLHQETPQPTLTPKQPRAIHTHSDTTPNSQPTVIDGPDATINVGE